MNVAAFALAAFLAGSSTEEIDLTATSVNVAEPGTPVKIKILRWSTDEERAPILVALNPVPPRSPARNSDAAPTGRGRAGRGRGRGAAAAPLSPIAAFSAALGRAQTIGYIWTNDITGYAIKYAWHASLPDGTERVVLASDRRLGAYTDAWKPSTPAADTDYSFTLLELRTGPKGLIEGKTSLNSKIVVDEAAKSVVLDNYAAAGKTLTGATAVTGLRPPLHP